jgi:hypothetical protein
VKVDRQGYIIAYRRLVVRGQPTGNPDGPYHVADIASYTELDLDRLSETIKDGEGRATAPRTVDDGRRTGVDMSSGVKDFSELITSSESNGSDKPMDIERNTST